MTEAGAETPIPAATIILFRPQADGPPQHLMLERAQDLTFGAGALVFPGGRIDASDRALAALRAKPCDSPEQTDEEAAKIAAIRESIEETGIAVAIVPTPTPGLICSWRLALARKEPLAALLADAAMTLDLDALVPFARWCPPLGRPRRYNTYFFVARVGTEGVAIADGGEATLVRWLTAREILDDADRGRHQLMFPTHRTVERLAAHESFEAILAHLRTVPLRTISPYVEHRTDGDYLCIPEGLGYPVTAVPLPVAWR